MKYYEKIQIDLLKNEAKKQAKKRYIRNFVQAATPWIYICIDGTHMHFILDEFFYLDAAKFEVNNSLEKLANDAKQNNSTPATLTGMTITIANNIDCAELATEDGRKIYVTSKILKEYGDKSDLTFYVNDDTSKKFTPVLIRRYVNGHIPLDVGIVMPVNVNK